MPRKLDLNIARTQEGSRKYRVYFGKWDYINFTSGSVVRQAFSSGTVYTFNISSYSYNATGTDANISEAIADLVDDFNTQQAALLGGADYTAEIKDDYVLISEIGVQTEFTTVTVSGSGALGNSAWVVPHNYIADYSEEINIEFPRRKPNVAPTFITKIYNPEGLPNNVSLGRTLNSKALQFAWSYVFFDKSESVVSDFSLLKPTDYIDGTRTESITHIVLTFIDELIPALSSSANDDFFRDLYGINIYYREENSGFLKLWKTITQSQLYPSSASDANIGEYFTIDSNGTAVSDTVANKLFESVPKKIGALLPIYTDNGSVLALANTTENYDYQPVDLTISVEYISGYQASTVNSLYFSPSRYLKMGSRYKVGVVWKDKYGATFGVSLSSQSDVYVTRKGEARNKTKPSVLGGTTSIASQAPSITWTIANNVENIPVWAHSYFLAITDNLTYGYFRQFEPYNIIIWNTDADAIVPVSPALTAFESNHEIRINISKLEAEYGDAYSFVAGDRIRVLSYVFDITVTPVIENNTGIDGSTKVGDPDFEILGVEGDYIRIRAIDNNAWNIFQHVLASPSDTDATSAKKWHKFEIYRASQASENLFYKFSPEYLVTDPETSSRSLSTGSGSSKNKYGDVYYRRVDSTRAASQGAATDTTWADIETQNRDLKKQSLFWSKDRGSAYLYLPRNIETNYYNNIRIGNQLSSSGDVNQLFSFDALSKVETPGELGPISVIERVGDVILALTKNSAAITFYLQKVTSVDGNGNVQMAYSDALIGGRNVLANRYGCMHPDTMVVRNSQAFWVDIRQRAVLQYTMNGINPISELKVESYFDTNLASKTVDDLLLGGYDPENDNYLVCGVKAETFAYAIKKRGWRGFFDYNPELFVTADKLLFCFLNGIPYLMNDITQNRQTYFKAGVSSAFNWSYSVSVIANNNPSAVKTFLAIEENASSVWTVEVTTEEGQETEMTAAHFDLDEGKYSVAVMMDKNSPGGASEDENWVNGDPMRGTAFTIKLSGNNTAKTVLRDIIARQIPSTRSTN